MAGRQVDGNSHTAAMSVRYHGDMMNGKHIRQTRKSLGISQKTLADQVGISQSMLSRIETQLMEPAADTAKLLAEVLNLELPPMAGAGLLTPEEFAGWLPPARVRMAMQVSEITPATRWNQARLTLGRDAFNPWLQQAVRHPS